LERAGAEPIPMHQVPIPPHRLLPQPLKMPAPAAPELLPRKLSASGYNSLVACPYQFFATRMLELDGLGELSDMPEKRDYGDWLHRILTAYHEIVRDKKIALHERQALLQEISQKIFDDEIARSAAALGYYSRWQKVMPAYLDWANERESQGWYFVAGEQRFDKTLQWDGGKITLHGRIDRIDHNEAGERAVLDYKTRNLQALRDKLKEGEDHQLAFYGMLSDLPVAYAHYVALETVKDKTGAADAPNFEDWQRMLEAQLVAAMRAILQGAPLRATGINRVCEFCEVRGLCRKGAWS
jgi:ATP-dependent helicase/nuclease subunit B